MSETKVATSKKRKPLKVAQNDPVTEEDEKQEKKVKIEPVMQSILAEDINFDMAAIPTRNQKGELVFEDHPEFRPNLTPEEVIRLGKSSWHHAILFDFKITLLWQFIMIHVILMFPLTTYYFLGSFGGTYFRPIYSAVCKRSFTSEEAMAGLPAEWFRGLDMKTQVTSEK